MKKISLLFFSLLVLTGCKNNIDKTVVTVQLDYLINTNHTGLYVALEKNFFEDENLNISIIEAATSEPLSAVALNKVDFAYSYEENIIYAHSSTDPLPIQAIYAVVQNNTSGLIYKKNKIQTVQDLAGKTYGTWNSPIEEAIIKTIIKNNNLPENSIDSIVLSNDNVFQNLAGEIDFQWVFYGWDMTNAISKGIDEDYSFLYLQEIDEALNFYTPVIASNKNVDQELAEKFLTALNKGYLYAIDNPIESAEILHKYAPEYDLEHLKHSQIYLSEQYAKDGRLGLMKKDVWQNFYNWMSQNNIVQTEIDVEELYTNEFIK